MKLSMLLVTGALIVWIGWPTSQDSRSDPDEPTAPTVPSSSESRDGNPTERSATGRTPARLGLTQDHGRVDLNRASVEELEQLPGIGNVLAQRVVEWRGVHGRFRSIEELGNVKGIGAKKLARIRPLVTVGRS
jgi:competence protein ComEA